MDPLVFEPYFRPQIWGGRRLERYLGRPLPGDGTFGEAWVLSTQALHVSRVAEGPYQGVLFTDLWKEQANALTGQARPASQFPLLLKYLDCPGPLSIQVHPNNEIADRLRPGELGKTEAWVVLNADPAARVYAGLRPGVTQDRLEECLADGSLADCLHSFVPRKGDCVFFNAGTVHAVGGGVLMAEVQQTSDATFRLFDWNRLGTDGKPRTCTRRRLCSRSTGRPGRSIPPRAFLWICRFRIGAGDWSPAPTSRSTVLNLQRRWNDPTAGRCRSGWCSRVPPNSPAG